jgi:hypothetical protein
VPCYLMPENRNHETATMSIARQWFSKHISKVTLSTVDGHPVEISSQKTCSHSNGYKINSWKKLSVNI